MCLYGLDTLTQDESNDKQDKYQINLLFIEGH